MVKTVQPLKFSYSVEIDCTARIIPISRVSRSTE